MVEARFARREERARSNAPKDRGLGDIDQIAASRAAEGFACFDRASSSRRSQSCSRSLILGKPDNSAPFWRTDWRRSSLYRPASKLSRDDERTPTDRAPTAGG